MNNKWVAKKCFKYDDYIFKLKNVDKKNNFKNNNLILITSINPTKYGEGKTTTLIGLVDLFNHFGLSASGCLRQPSIGPYFGMKGGATGSGKCSIKNSDFVNLGLTGDFEKIALVNNLIMSILENEIFNGNWQVKLKEINWRRCIDLNDRSLRNINYKIKNQKLKSSFTITAACDIMSLFCLSKNIDDFLDKLENAEICITKHGEIKKIKDLNIRDAIKKAIEKALNPNIVFTRKNNLIFMHGGPFANISIGTNSLISTFESMKFSNYTFVECGFGSDLGLEKFVNIVSREGNLKPKLVIYAISFSSLKIHGDNDFHKMSSFLIKHLSIPKSFNLNAIVLLNKFSDDNYFELRLFVQYASKLGIKIMISNLYNKPLSYSKKLINFIKKNINDNKLVYSYNINDDVFEKISKISYKIYGVKKVIYSKKALSILKKNRNLKYYLCMAKDYKFILPKDGILKISHVQINHSAKMIVPICDNIFLMPGLPKVPNAKLIK